LLPLYPLLGFCWSGFKERVLWPIGFLPPSITAASTMLTVGFVLVDGILFGFLGGGLIAQLRLHVPLANLFDLLLLATMSLDCAVRYGQLLDHEPVPDGFLEWALRFGRPR
jgi:hypothetical protein